MTDSPTNETAVEVAAEIDLQPAAPESLTELEPDDVVLDSGDAALSLREANELAGELGATVVVVAGPQAVGKTTMAVTLWGQFLHGPFGNFQFAGSRSLDAFDQRQFASRLSSRNRRAETLRTEDEDIRLLHLRVVDLHGTASDLLPSDIKGEFFEDLINGRPATDGLQALIARADKVIVAVDGAKVASLEDRATAIFETQQLIGALTEPGWIHRRTPLLLLLTKNDLVVDPEMDTWYDIETARLCTFASDRGLMKVSTAKVSARPVVIGFEELLRWMHRPVERGSGVTVNVRSGGRVFTSGIMA